MSPKIDPFDAAILKALKRINLPMTTRRISVKTRMHPTTAKLHLKKLSGLGKVKRVTSGKRKKYRV